MIVLAQISGIHSPMTGLGDLYPGGQEGAGYAVCG